ncbi:MAG: Transcription elongation factor GreA [Nocardioides sp.]|jgi:transcription elongation factor GreA|nr:Transcription elongation factor GreA [Nocardioides sp.]
MAVTSPTETSAELLSTRLASLRAERAELISENLLEAAGDAADRAPNVEAAIRLGLLDERIAAVELEIEASRHYQHTEGVVSIGDRVVLDLGDGPETYAVGSVEQAVAGVDTITPNSPLGRAIVGAAVGTTVTYSPRRGVRLSATIISA